ncbi:PAC2 family protein [Nakamurella deserti]|uniref:PAC2 family protein n=1 Tax=Nakamurella deserti TaxID=2164074 RepID=UPI000DBEA458|nr:PAC2 family protein [Nakamurella deserti]
MSIEPGDLYELHLEDDRVALIAEPVLVHALEGFVDAGSAVRLAVENILATREHFTLATFDADLLIDYRARRPVLTFEQDRFTAVDPPEIKLFQVMDADGTPFLLLVGLEPDVYWERFIEAVGQIADRFGVRMTIGLNAIPLGVPHTRPTGMTAHATRDGLVSERPFWAGSMQVPGYIGGLLELRFGEKGRDAVGFSAHVPHYLARSEFPDASLELMDALTKTTGLTLPTTELTETAASVRNDIDAQVAGSEEVAGVVHALEEQYDSFIAARGRGLLAEDAPLPTADELGAEFEAFLRRNS